MVEGIQSWPRLPHRPNVDSYFRPETRLVYQERFSLAHYFLSFLSFTGLVGISLFLFLAWMSLLRVLKAFASEEFPARFGAY